MPVNFCYPIKAEKKLLRSNFSSGNWPISLLTTNDMDEGEGTEMSLLYLVKNFLYVSKVNKLVWNDMRVRIKL